MITLQMTLVTVAKKILQKVFVSLDCNNYILTNNHLYDDFLVVPGNGALRWLVPVTPELGANVLAQWSPYGTRSKIKWQLLRLFYQFKLLEKIPGVNRLSLSNTIKDNQSYVGEDDLIKKIEVVPVIYVGTPGPQQKIVVMLVNVVNKKTVAIMKIALGQEAKKSILQEANILNLLAKLGIKNTPRPIGIDESSGVSWQTEIEGKLSKRRLTLEHINWLLNLPKSGKKSTINQQKEHLVDLLNNYEGELTALQATQISTALDDLNGNDVIELSLIHGDFAPWNIKHNKITQCAVIDWEDANINGLPLWDLCHFTFIQAYLFDEERRIINFMASITKQNSLAYHYLKNTGIVNKDAKQLIILYILFMVLNKNTSFAYKTFLINHIVVVINK